MDIVCSTDDNYIKYCCVMLTSLLENLSSTYKCNILGADNKQ